MPLVAWPHCSYPPDPVRDPSNRERSGLLALIFRRSQGKVTIQFSTSKARVDRTTHSAAPCGNVRVVVLMRLLSPPNCQRTTRLDESPKPFAAPGCSAPEGLS